MEELASIDIEGKTLACSHKEIDKLSSPEGCSMKLVTDRVYSLNEDSDEEEMNNTEDVEGISSVGLSKPAKIERMKREFISLTLNSNRDPIKPGGRSRLRKILDDNEDLDTKSPETIAATFDLSKSYHRRYEKLGNFQQLTTNVDDQGKRLFEDISPNRVYKRCLVPGAGAPVTENSLIIYNCALWIETGTEPFDSTWLRRNTNIADLSNDSILPGLYELLMTTKRGEWCEAIIMPEAAFGRLGAPPRIPANSIIFCLLELVKVVDKDRIAQLDFNPAASQESGTTFEDFYEASDEARKRGNYYFEQNQFRPALQRYKSGIRILEALTYKDEKEEVKARQLLVKLYNNCARAANRFGEPRFALVACKQAMLLEDREPKTYWNKLTAWKRLGHLDRALGTARRAMQLFPEPKTHRTFEIEAGELKRRIQHEERESDNLHKLMGRALLC